jgi:hypothetical protein
VLGKCSRERRGEHVARDAAHGVEVDVLDGHDGAFTENLMRGRVQNVGATTVRGVAPT